MGDPLLGQVASYNLFLIWGSRCWDRFAIYSFAKLWVPAGTGAYHAAVGRIASCQHRGNGWARPQKFWNTFVDSQFFGRVSNPYSSLGMKVALKNWAGMDSFPIHRLT